MREGFRQLRLERLAEKALPPEERAKLKKAATTTTSGATKPVYVAGSPHTCAAFNRKRTNSKRVLHVRRCKTCRAFGEALAQHRLAKQGDAQVAGGAVPMRVFK